MRYGALAQDGAENRFRLRTARGRKEVGLVVLDKLEQKFRQVGDAA